MKLICPECKNEVDLELVGGAHVGEVVECNHCGISLIVNQIRPDGTVETEIVEASK